MSFDPTGRYKGNKYDPNFAAKKGGKQQGGNPNKKKEKDQGWHNKQQHQRSNGGGPGGGPGGPGGGPGSRDGDYAGNMGPSPSPRGGRNPHYDSPSSHGQDGYHPSNGHGYGDRQMFHNSAPDFYHQDFHHHHPDPYYPDHMMGNHQPFQIPRDNGYGNRANRDSDPPLRERFTGPSDNTQGWDALPYGGASPPVFERPHSRMSEPRSKSSASAVLNASAPPFTPTDPPQNLPPSSNAPPQAERKETANGGEAELNSLEKLKLFKAQVEASRARKASQATDSVTRVAESFLLSQAERGGSDSPKTTATSVQPPAPSTMPPPPPPKIVTGESGVSAEEGEITDGTVPREQLLKAKLRQKMAQVKGSSSSPADSNPSSPAHATRPKEAAQLSPQKKAKKQLPPTKNSAPSKKQAEDPTTANHRESVSLSSRPPRQHESSPEKRASSGRSASPKRTSPKRHTSPPRKESRRRSRSPPPARRESDHHPNERRPSAPEFDRFNERSGHDRADAFATPSNAGQSVPAANLFTPPVDWVLRQMELLKAQMVELEKLVPMAIATGTGTPQAPPAEQHESARRQQRAPSVQYETPTRRPLDQDAPPYHSPEQRSTRSLVHESRKHFVPKHDSKPYDRPQESYTKPYYKKSYENSHDSGYSPSYEKKPYHKYDSSYDKGYKKPYYKKHGGDYEGGYTGGYSKYRQGSPPNEEYFEKKPYYKKYDYEGGPSRGGYRGRGRGRGGYHNHGDHQYTKEYNPNYKKSYGGYDEQGPPRY